MPRTPRGVVGGVVYHVLNRANARLTIFEREEDYEAFERVLQEGCQRIAMRILAWCLMPNHWHLVLWPRGADDMSEFMHWVGVTHTQRWHTAHASVGTGHIYQGRYKSFPVQTDQYYLTLCRYVERNALRAGLVKRAQDWRWGSLWRRVCGSAEQQMLLTAGPTPLPANWVSLVNHPQPDEQLRVIRQCVVRGRPFGQVPWVERTARRLHIESTLRPRGRPRKDAATNQPSGKCT